jgi:hypothetical protein
MVFTFFYSEYQVATHLTKFSCNFLKLTSNYVLNKSQNTIARTHSIKAKSEYLENTNQYCYHLGYSLQAVCS